MSINRISSKIKFRALAIILSSGILTAGLTSCSESEFEEEVPYVGYEDTSIDTNTLQDLKGKDLNILFIGNSFGVDVSFYLPDLLACNNIRNIKIGRLYKGDCTLSRHCEGYEKQEAIYEDYYQSINNTWEKAAENCTLQETLANEKWNIVILQEHSCYYDNAENILRCAEELENDITKELGYKPRFIWLMSWAYAKSCRKAEFARYDYSQAKMFNAIINTTYHAIRTSGLFSAIVPCGTAVQNIRHTRLNNHPWDFTRDGYHMDLGAGRFLLGYTLFQSIIAPIARDSLQTDSFRVNAGNIAVTDENIDLLMQCAQLAIKQKYKLSSTDE